MTTIVDVIQNFKDCLQTGLRDADIKASDGKDFELIFFGEDSKILPCIIFQALEVCPAETFSTTGVTMWNFGLVIRYPFTDYKGFIAGLDPHNEEGVLRMVLQKAEECGLFVPQDSPDSVGLALDADGMAMQVWEYRAALAMGTTATPEPEVLPADAIPPTLDTSLNDVWGISVDGDILYLTEGSPSTVEESEIHSYDLTDNTRRTSEISAGITQAQHHRGLTVVDGYAMLVDDDGTRGSWVLNIINATSNTLVATRDLGVGDFTGCCFIFTGLQTIAVAKDNGTTTSFDEFNFDFSTFAASDTANLDRAIDGEVAGMTALGATVPYVYMIVGSTAICVEAKPSIGSISFVELSERVPRFDIDLGRFRVQWHDCTRRGNYLWVSGTQDNGDGTSTGLIEAFKLPQEIIDSLT